MMMTNKYDQPGRSHRRPINLALMIILAVVGMVLSGCASTATVKKEPDITNLKLEDFSELKVPGSGSAALFKVSSYDVDIEKFAIVRIAAEQMQSILPQNDRGEHIKDDGIYAALVRKNRQTILTGCLVESKAKPVKDISLLFYDTTPEDFWLQNTNDHGNVEYKDIDGNVHWLNTDEGYLGISFGVVFERHLLGIPITISPQFQRKNVLPDVYLKKIGDYNANGRMMLSELSFSTSMNIGDFILICPDMVPVDEGTFSKYLFEGEKKSQFRIYCVYCKSITGI